MIEYCTCNIQNPCFLKDRNLFCFSCNKDIKCPVPDVSLVETSSNAIGALPLNGLNVSESLIQLLKNSEIQQNQINELTKGVEYLAQQVKTLVDALAEDADPDAPLTNYLSGRPI